MDNESTSGWMSSVVSAIDRLEQRLNELVESVDSDTSTIYKRVNNATTKADELLKRVAEIEQLLREVQVWRARDVDRMGKRVNTATAKADELMNRVAELEKLAYGMATEQPQQPSPVELSEKARKGVWMHEIVIRISSELDLFMAYTITPFKFIAEANTEAGLIDAINEHFEGK